MERNLLYQEIGQVLSVVAPVSPFNRVAGLDHEQPALVSAAGTTYYPDLSAASLKFPNSGIFVPAHFKVRDGAVDIILYFHGLIPPCKGNTDKYRKLGMKYLLEEGIFFKSLCPKIAAAGKNVLFIALTTMLNGKSYDKYYPNQIRAASFNELMDSSLSVLTGLKVLPPGTRPGTIILAGHSAGGAPMQRIIGDTGSGKGYLKNIRECWGFDSQYSTGKTPWPGWLKQDPERHRYRHVSVQAPIADKERVDGLVDKIIDAAKRKYEGAMKKFEEEKMKNSAAKPPKLSYTIPPYLNISRIAGELKKNQALKNSYEFKKGDANHCGMVDRYMGEFIRNSPNLK